MPDGAVPLAEQFRLRLRPVAVADRIDQEVAQRVAFEQFAENVVNLAAEGDAGLFQFLKKAPVDLALVEPSALRRMVTGTPVARGREDRPRNARAVRT
jgi:hypothetical protein